MKQNKAEKLLAGVLSISLAMGVSVMPAFAAQVQGLRMRICLHPDGCCGRRAAADPAPPPSEVSAEEIRQGR